MSVRRRLGFLERAREAKTMDWLTAAIFRTNPTLNPDMKKGCL